MNREVAVLNVDTIIKWKWWLFALIFLGGAAALFQRWLIVRENRHDPAILAAARRYGVDPALVKAIVWRESKFDPDARGRAGELGLMQVRAEAANEWAKAERVLLLAHYQMTDPAKNTLAGTWYLRKALRRYKQADNPIPYALADYNAGRTHVIRWSKGIANTNSAAFLEQIDFPGTRAYIQAIMSRREHYRRQFPAAPPQPPATVRKL